MKKTRTSKSSDLVITTAVSTLSRTEPSPSPSPSPSAEALVRLLVARASESGASATGTEDGVLLRTEVDGFTCVVTRPASSRAPSPELQSGVAARLPSAGVALSPREREIARLIAKGYPDKVIASVLEIS